MNAIDGKIDYSKMTPDFYEKVLNARKTWNQAKKNLTIMKLDFGEDDETRDIEEKLNEWDEDLKLYEF